MRLKVGDATTGGDGTGKVAFSRSWFSAIVAADRSDYRMTESALMRIGIAVLGRMGAAMAARLIEVGHEVTVWNRSAAKAKPVIDAGGKMAQSPAGLAS